MAGFPVAAPVEIGMSRFLAQGDPVDFLPDAAADRLRALRQARDDAKAVLTPGEVRDELRMQKAESERRLRELRSHQSEGGRNLPVDHPSVVSEQRKLEKVTTEIARIDALDQTRFERFNQIGRLVTRIEQWCRGEGRPGGTEIVAVENPPPPLMKGETHMAAVARHRLRLNELAAQAHRTRSAPLRSSDAKQRMRAGLAAIAERGAPDLSRLVEIGGPVDWPMTMARLDIVSSSADLHGHAMGELPDAFALTVWLNRKVLANELDILIDAAADDASALDDKTRAERLASIADERLLIERNEVAAIEAAASENIVLDYRADCDPRAALSVELVTRAPALPSGSSPEHILDIVGGGKRR